MVSGDGTRHEDECWLRVRNGNFTNAWYNSSTPVNGYRLGNYSHGLYSILSIASVNFLDLPNTEWYIDLTEVQINNLLAKLYQLYQLILFVMDGSVFVGSLVNACMRELWFDDTYHRCLCL